MKLPATGTPREALLDELRAEGARDVDWRHGKIWRRVYFASDEVGELLKDAYSMFLYTNGLGPTAFRSLKRFESEVIATTADLLGDSRAVGNMTSGGTESILMAVKAARDLARAERPHVREP